MNNQSSQSRELLIPILLGGFSLVGIVMVLLIGRALSAPGEIAATPSSTPFQYIFLGTEPAIATPVDEESEFPATEPPATEAPIFETPTRRPTNTPLIFRTSTATSNGSLLRTNTPGRTATSTRTNTPSAANMYDDTDSRLTYTPKNAWIAQRDLTGLNAPYNGTLHISDVADNKSVTFQFSGEEIYFYYLSGPSGGVVTIYLDDDPLAITTVNQARDGGVWHYFFESSKTHKIKIEHTGGGSVNIDRFMIPAPTATPPSPTRTPTP